MTGAIAWRNVWRNKLRSALVVGSIAVGLWGGTYFMALAYGMYAHQLDLAIADQLSHLQVHDPRFRDEEDGRFGITGAAELLDEVRQDPRVAAATGRIVLPGIMVQSTANGAGVTVQGIDPEQEQQVTHLADRLDTGAYLSGTRSAPMVVGAALARKLKVDLRDRVVISFLNAQDSLVSMSFRITGIYRSANSAWEEANVFVDIADLAKQMKLADAANEVAILLHEDDDLDAVQADLRAAHPGLAVESWKELSPDLRLMVESFGQYMYIFIGIILLALMFGIVNTMLMAVLERVRELGMLMAIGMGKARLFTMIMLEALYMALIGAPLGMLLAWGTITLTHRTGIDLSAFSAGLSSFGFESVIHTELEPRYYLEIGLLGLAGAVLSTLYPAWKALQLNPIEAIRKI